MHTLSQAEVIGDVLQSTKDRGDEVFLVVMFLIFLGLVLGGIYLIANKHFTRFIASFDSLINKVDNWMSKGQDHHNETIARFETLHRESLQTFKEIQKESNTVIDANTLELTRFRERRNDERASY